MRIHSVSILIFVTLFLNFTTSSGSVLCGQQATKSEASNDTASNKEIVTGDEKVAGRTLAQWQADLSSPNEIVRLRAVKSLGPFGMSAVTILQECLSDESDAVQYWAADHLGSIGPKVSKSKSRASVVNSLEAIIKTSPEKAVSMAAAYALFKVDAKQEHLDLVIKRLSHGERGMACSAAEFLGKIGSPAEAALPELQKKYKEHGDYHVRGACLNAIRKIKGEPVL